MANETNDMPSRYPWRFFRAGGFDQVLLDSGQDLLALKFLDQKLWVALSCPVGSVEFDRRTLELLDTDQDGHIRVPEVLAAVDWAGSRVTDPDLLVRGGEGIPLAAINDQLEEGRRLLASARAILDTLCKGGAERITVEDVAASETLFAQRPFNGDGVITAASTDDQAMKGWIADVVACLGGEVDRNGEPGLSRDKVEQFGNEAAAWLEWQSAPERNETLSLSTGDMVATVELWGGIKAKIDDYFLRCRLASYDSRAALVMNGKEEDLLSLSTRNLAEAGDDIAALPLSTVSAAGVLDLEQGVNPAWATRIEQFRQDIVAPLLGAGERLTFADWEALKERFVSYEEWWGARVDTPVAQLGAERLRAWKWDAVADSLYLLLDQDLSLQAEADTMIEVERLTRYCRDLYPLLNNFVSFRDFYRKNGKAIFQAGSLYMDGRCCELCVPVADVAKHAALATLSRVYLAYCECTRAGGSERITIAAAFTNGDSDHIMVGRNGVFYDRQGRDWDATVVRVIEHPISIRQGFWAPYKRIGKMIGEQVEKIAAAKSKAAEDKAAASMLQTGTPPKDAAKPQAVQQAFDIGKFVGIFAAIGLALGAIGTAIVSTVTGFLKLAWWQMPLAVAGIMLLISGPSMIIAWLKLRQRNLGPILDANGWAVNARARLNIPFGASLTSTARLPEGSRLQLSDPYAEKKTPWLVYLVAVIILAAAFMAWQSGWFKLICKIP
jgi:hypothetical protein